MDRRTLFKACGAIAGGYLVARSFDAIYRGLRFPTLQGEPEVRPMRLNLLSPGISIDLEGAYIQNVTLHDDVMDLELRAFTPEPVVELATEDDLTLKILFRNVSGRASLKASPGASPEEQWTRGINRKVRFDLSAGLNQVSYRVPFTQAFRFTAIGDSGGGSELDWCLKRSHQLGADFVLHMGDIYYEDADFDRIAGILDDSPLPVYATIGNHDFHRGGEDIHLSFTQQVGPRNFAFQMGDTMFVSFDTAASTWPVSFADRADLFESMQFKKQGINQRKALFGSLQQPQADVDHWILFTHRPIHDPRFPAEVKKPHTVSDFEKQWLLEQLKAIDSNPVLLAGHIHISSEHEADGLKTYIAGDGLGTRDLVSGLRLAQMLVGNKEPGSPPTYHWEMLNMPFESYCHGKNRGIFNLTGKPTPPGAFGAYCQTLP